MIRSVFHRVFVVWPSRTYRFMGSEAGSVPYGAMLAGVLIALGVGGLGALSAGLLDIGRTDAFWIGAGVGIGLGVVWLVYSVIVVGVLRLTGSDWSQVVRRWEESR
jgi:hypothetical protein